MTLPEWVAPDPPDDSRAGGHQADPRPADRLAEKPVLEWTDEDWAQWIESAEPVRLPPPADRGPGEEPEPEVAEEPVAEAAVPVAEVVPEVAEEPVAEVEVPVPEVVEEPVAEVEVPVPEVVEPVAEVAEAVPEVEGTPVVVGPPARDEPPGPVDAAGSMGPPAPTEGEAAAEEDADQDWGRVADHPWWTSAPAPDEDAAAVLAPAAAPATTRVEVEEPTAGGPLQPVTRPLRPPAPTAKAKPGPRPAPARGKGRPAPRRPVDREREHRLRSALGLLGMAVMTGMVLAALITVAIVSISLVVQRALGD